MKKQTLLYLVFSVFLLACSSSKGQRELSSEGFVDLESFQKTRLKRGALKKNIAVQMAYNTPKNFVGERVDGYHANKCFLTKKAAVSLLEAQKLLLSQGYSLVVFDCYRPQKAVNHFVRWSKDKSDTKTKGEYYPKISPKTELFKQGYIAKKSGHSRGSTIDLGLQHVESKKLVDMGGAFDFFGEISHTKSPLISEQQKVNRRILLEAMDEAGFYNYKNEWWHYTLRNEPYPKSYFNFDVK